MKWVSLMVGLVALVAVGCSALVSHLVEKRPVVSERIVSTTNELGEVTIRRERTTNEVDHPVAVPGPALDAALGVAETGLLGPWGELAAGAIVIGFAAYNRFRKWRAKPPIERPPA